MHSADPLRNSVPSCCPATSAPSPVSPPPPRPLVSFRILALQPAWDRSEHGCEVCGSLQRAGVGPGRRARADHPSLSPPSSSSLPPPLSVRLSPTRSLTARRGCLQLGGRLVVLLRQGPRRQRVALAQRRARRHLRRPQRHRLDRRRRQCVPLPPLKSELVVRASGCALGTRGEDPRLTLAPPPLSRAQPPRPCSSRARRTT